MATRIAEIRAQPVHLGLLPRQPHVFHCSQFLTLRWLGPALNLERVGSTASMAITVAHFRVRGI